LKPFPLRRLEKLPGGTGIMMDDVGAGLYALVLLQLWLHLVAR
jgi:phosphatidylglycerophosphatase A